MQLCGTGKSSIAPYAAIFLELAFTCIFAETATHSDIERDIRLADPTARYMLIYASQICRRWYAIASKSKHSLKTVYRRESHIHLLLPNMPDLIIMFVQSQSSALHIAGAQYAFVAVLQFSCSCLSLSQIYTHKQS